MRPGPASHPLRNPPAPVTFVAMIYCVVPRPLADTLYPKLVEHYEHANDHDLYPPRVVVGD